MPIPPFDGVLNVLPPHLGDPRDPAHLSPYVCTAEELCDRFATSMPRKRILEGLLALRAELFALGIQGFQWLDGSLLEDVEKLEGRDPADIDVITFVGNPANPADFNTTMSARPSLLSRAHVKSMYFVDHFWVPLFSAPRLLVSQSRYWYALFSHRRDRIWKGMLAVDLVDQADDQAATVVLRSKP